MMPPDSTTPLGRLIREDGRPQRAIAEAAGLDQPNLQRIAAGKTDPRLSTVARVLEALGKRWADLDDD